MASGLIHVPLPVTWLMCPRAVSQDAYSGACDALCAVPVTPGRPGNLRQWRRLFASGRIAARFRPIYAISNDCFPIVLPLIFALNRGGRSFVSQIYHFLIIVSLPFSFFWKLQFIGVCESCGLFNLRLIKEIENFSYIFWKLAADFLKGEERKERRGDCGFIRYSVI